MFNITCEKSVPADQWESSPAQFPTDELYAQYIRDLAQIQEEYRLRNPLDPDDFRGNKFTDELLVKIVEYSRPRGGAVESSQESTYIELYKKVFTAAFTNRIRSRAEDIKSKAVGRRKAQLEEIGVRIKGVPLRSFHILDDGGDSSKAFRTIINFIEAETGSTIAWNHLSTYSAGRSVHDRTEHVKDKSHWTKGVDGDGMSIANYRAWKNKIVTTLKNVDVIVVNSYQSSDNDGNCACAIAFVLANLNASGTGIVALKLSALAAASTISLIHLFATCFERAEIIHTATSDRLFLCGTDFKNTISVRAYPQLVAACENSNSIFSPEYMNGAEFTATVEKLIDVIRAASTWRLAQYRKMFRLYAEISTSASAQTIRGHVDKMLERAYE
jgi:hypothetical protein